MRCRWSPLSRPQQSKLQQRADSSSTSSGCENSWTQTSCGVSAGSTLAPWPPTVSPKERWTGRRYMTSLMDAGDSTNPSRFGVVPWQRETTFQTAVARAGEKGNASVGPRGYFGCSLFLRFFASVVRPLNKGPVCGPLWLGNSRRGIKPALLPVDLSDREVREDRLGGNLAVAI